MWIQRPAPAGCLREIRRFPSGCAARHGGRDGPDWTILACAGPILRDTRRCASDFECCCCDASCDKGRGRRRPATFPAYHHLRDMLPFRRWRTVPAFRRRPKAFHAFCRTILHRSARVKPLRLGTDFHVRQEWGHTLNSKQRRVSNLLQHSLPNALAAGDGRSGCKLVCLARGSNSLHPLDSPRYPNDIRLVYSELDAFRPAKDKQPGPAVL